MAIFSRNTKEGIAAGRENNSLIFNLNDDIIGIILRFLAHGDVLCLSRSSKRFHSGMKVCVFLEKTIGTYCEKNHESKHLLDFKVSILIPDYTLACKISFTFRLEGQSNCSGDINVLIKDHAGSIVASINKLPLAGHYHNSSIDSFPRPKACYYLFCEFGNEH